ncbi:esterase [Colwellia sp. KU-HH00111]|uniref:YqiA/YcfP family alpha/beta fold hydrolase n=1 Tax=Colwellia sp. KU-HH00111 TaxID=3127652 RepID=UPI003104364B
MQTNILFIHGFNSSPLSHKAELTRQYFQQYYPSINFICPQLATSPKAAILQLESIIEDATPLGTHDGPKATQWLLIGSSLGGYFASYLANTYQLAVVLINPAIKPYELLEDYIGEQKNPYTGITYQVTTEHMHDLKMIEQSAPNIDEQQKNNYLVMVQTGDEVLDYQQAVEKYQHCRLIIEQGGDHSFVGFETKLPIIADFLQL